MKRCELCIVYCSCSVAGSTNIDSLVFTYCREGEAEFIRERDDTVPGHEWERICRLCEFNPKASRTTRDVGRMRGILLQLKQNPLVKAQ